MAKRENTKNKTDKQEANAYDKIFKESSEESFLELAEEELGFKIKTARRLKVRLQRTLEREMDYFFEITTETGDVFILHIEVETSDNFEMVYRTGEYHSLGLRIHKLPIRHVVIYAGSKTPKMRTKLKPNEVYKGFELIVLRKLNFKKFLASTNPKKVLLSVLADFKIEEAEKIIVEIVEKILTLEDKSEIEAHLSQLIVFSHLRKIERITFQILKDMPVAIDIKSSYFYKQGAIETRNEDKINFVKNLLLEGEYDVKKIARLVGVSVDFVEKVKLEESKK